MPPLRKGHSTVITPTVNTIFLADFSSPWYN